jgi:polar amino acid transport system permease protein
MIERVLQTIDLSLFFSNLGYLLPGLTYNFVVFVLAALLAVTLGLSIALMRISRTVVIRMVATVYTEFFRDTPEYVLVLWVHYVVPVLLSQLLATRLNLPPVLSAVLALGVASSGYFAETFRAGIQAIPRGHVEAALSLGLTRAQVMRRIVLPQAIRLMLPEALNNLVSLFKGTTLISLIAVPDLLYKTQVLNQYEMKPLPLYTGVAIVYFTVIFVISSLARFASERWRAKVLA